jgi:eukaryotic translation initiation factor 2C
MNRYAPGELLGQAMKLLGYSSDIREFVRRCDAAAIRKLRAFYKGVTIVVQKDNRKRKIADIIPAAGSFEFQGAEGAVMTVKVCL